MYLLNVYFSCQRTGESFFVPQGVEHENAIFISKIQKSRKNFLGMIFLQAKMRLLNIVSVKNGQKNKAYCISNTPYLPLQGNYLIFSNQVLSARKPLILLGFLLNPSYLLLQPVRRRDGRWGHGRGCRRHSRGRPCGRTQRSSGHRRAHRRCPGAGRDGSVCRAGMPS